MKKFDFFFENGVPYIGVILETDTVSGGLQLFVIDTGASNTTISCREAEQLGFEMTKVKKRSIQKVATALEVIYPKIVALKSFETLGLKVKNYDVQVIDFADGTAGVIGNDFLSRFGKIKINYDTQIIEVS
jgi:predicted aspartyl protease